MYLSMTIWAYQLKILRIIRATITSSDDVVNDKNVDVCITAALASWATIINQTLLKCSSILNSILKWPTMLLVRNSGSTNVRTCMTTGFSISS
jgi:hypothetical protein